MIRATIVTAVLMLPGCALSAGCASDPALRVPEISPAPSKLTTSELAQRFLRALERADGLHVQQRTFENGRGTTAAESWMTRDSIRTDVYSSGERVYSLSVRGVRARESIPEGAVADGRHGPRFEEYTLERAGQIGYPRLVGSGWCCSFGDLTGTWLGPNCALPRFMGERISVSELLGVAEVSGVECAVVQWVEAPDASNPDRFRQGATYYLDLSRGWIVRSDGYQQEGRRRIDRVWVYRIEEATPDPAVFELDAQAKPNGR